MTWDLEKLYHGFSDPAFSQDSEKLEEVTGQLENLLAAPQDHPKEQLTRLLALMARQQELLSRLYSMVMLTLATDSENEEALALHDKMQLLFVRVRQVGSAFNRYVGSLDQLEQLIASDPLLTEHAFLLREAAKEMAHTIDPALEGTVLKLRITGSNAWSQLRDMLTSTLMIDFEQDGKVEQLPLSAIRNLAYSADADTRKRAYEAEIASYARIETPMAACLNGLKGEALTMLPLLHYDSLLQQTLDQARMDHETLEAMLTAMRESYPDFRRYFRAKARYLGHEGGLPFYDLFAPLGNASATYTLDQARDLLVEVLGKFSKKMGDHIQQAFDERWIDAYPHAGKQGGAFCAGVHPLRMSYVLTNFDGSLSSVSTLAHELGHAYHDRCLYDNSILNSDYPMPLAETASIFNETLLTSKLLENASPEEQVLLLDQEISDAAQVIVDIASRYLFESEVVKRRADHSLSVRELKEIMLDAQKQTYGDGLDENLLHPYMWACKSHYYSPDLHFYNFPYAFGLLFGKGIFAQYQQRGEAFVPEYDRLLQATATGNVVDVARSVGIDVRSVDFWRASLSVLREDIDRLCALLAG